MCARFRFPKIFAVQDDSSAEFLAIAHFDQRRMLWHNDSRGHTQQFALVSEGLAVISSGGCDDAALFLVAGNCERTLRAPRSLKLPVRCKLSSLQKISIPVSSLNGIEGRQGE